MHDSNDIQMSALLADLAFLALDHGVDSVRANGGPLTPFVAFEKDGKHELHRFAAERLEDGQQRAREFVAAFPPSVTACALAYDGYITVRDTKFDAIIVEASERGRYAGVCLAQRYLPELPARSFETVGNPAFVGDCETLFR